MWIVSSAALSVVLSFVWHRHYSAQFDAKTVDLPTFRFHGVFWFLQLHSLHCVFAVVSKVLTKLWISSEMKPFLGFVVVCLFPLWWSWQNAFSQIRIGAQYAQFHWQTRIIRFALQRDTQTTISCSVDTSVACVTFQSCMQNAIHDCHAILA